MGNTIQPVDAGVDVLARSDYAPLRGHQVGLVTNHTGLLRTRQTTIDALHEAPGVSLVAMFGPEHGIRGEYDMPNIDNSIDSVTGLPVYSLYGPNRAPVAEQLDKIDTLVFDIQDVGCRFYTYSATLGLLLEAASANNRLVMVLDRPNPINGLQMEGPLADPDRLNFTAHHPIPVRHGMTMGELAHLFKAERHLSCELEIIRCEGWHRADWFDATGLIWTNPSPNMRSLTQATLYPGVGLLETTNISVGRGTDTPFEVVGAPYIEPEKLALALNAERLPGIRFIPISFAPQSSRHAENRCGGVNLLVTDRDKLNAVQVGMTIAVLLRQHYPEAWLPERFIALLANQNTFDNFLAGQTYAQMMQDWTPDLEKFAVRRQAHLLYD